MNWHAMSDREKRVMVADCMGIDINDSIGRPIPFPKDYTSDHAAVALVREEVVRQGLEQTYISHLRDIVWSGEYRSYDYPSEYKWSLVNATPDQQCLAFVRACKREV